MTDRGQVLRQECIDEVVVSFRLLWVQCRWWWCSWRNNQKVGAQSFVPPLPFAFRVAWAVVMVPGAGDAKFSFISPFCQWITVTTVHIEFYTNRPMRHGVSDSRVNIFNISILEFGRVLPYLLSRSLSLFLTLQVLCGKSRWHYLDTWGAVRFEHNNRQECSHSSIW